MNFNEEYDQNLLVNRPKSFLNFSAVDNEFLNENNFVVLNLDNEEVADPEDLFNFSTGNYDELQNATPEKQESPQEIVDRPKIIKRRKTKQAPKSRVPRSWACDLCDEEFSNLKELKVHKGTFHVLAKFYKCQECFKDFNFEKNFMLHLATHTAAPAKCPECGKIFQRISSFIGHIETHMGDDNFKCKECDVEFEFEEYHERHMQKVHKETKMMVSECAKKRSRNPSSNKSYSKCLCKICGKSFPKLSLLVRHELGHTKMKPYECLECSQRFSQKSSLQRHYLVHEGIKPFNCPDCSLRFSQRTNLITHIKRVHPAKEDLGNKFQCNKCPCAFSKLKSLNRHITLTHSKITKTAHDDLSVNEFLEQMRSLQGDSSEQQVEGIDSHRHIESTTLPNQSDDIATRSDEIPRTSATLSENLYQEGQYLNLVDHINPNQEHAYRLVKEIYVDGVKRLECLHCHKKFQRPFDIVRHMRVHTKERPYECEICGRKFALKSTMKIHMKIHKKSRSGVTKFYSCHECKRHFYSAKTLEHHTKQHTSYKSHNCLHCSKAFKSKLSLERHQKIHQQTTPDQIEMREQLISDIPNEDDDPINDSISTGSSSYLKQQHNSHLGLKTFKCLMCQRKFTNESSLQNHQKLHLTSKAKKNTLIANSDLNRIPESILESFACPHCQQTFETNDFAYKKHISNHMTNVKSDVTLDPPEDIEHSQPAHNPEDDTLPCNYILLLDDPNSGNIGFDDLNLVLQQPDDLLFVDFTKIPENGISEEAESFLDMIGQPENQQNDLVGQSEFINIRDLPNSTNHLSKNIVVVSHEKDPENSENSQNSSLVETNSPTQEILFEEVRTKISGTITEKQKNSRKKPPHVCHICKRIFKKPIDLRRHIRTHTKEKPFKCDICTKAFSLKCILDDHKLTHQKDRPTIDCEICGKKYASKNVLNIHLRLHTGEKPYKCEICHKSFRTSGHRIVHMRIHSKEKLEASKKKKKG